VAGRRAGKRPLCFIDVPVLCPFSASDPTDPFPFKFSRRTRLPRCTPKRSEMRWLLRPRFSPPHVQMLHCCGFAALKVKSFSFHLWHFLTFFSPYFETHVSAPSISMQSLLFSLTVANEQKAETPRLWWSSSLRALLRIFFQAFSFSGFYRGFSCRTSRLTTVSTRRLSS